MKTTNNTLLIILTSLISTVSFAHGPNKGPRHHHYHYPHNCIKEFVNTINESVETSDQCELTKELRLTSKSQTYPNLRHNPRTVSYWEGQYQKEIVKTITSLREMVDVCRAKILSSIEITTVSTSYKKFNVENPNLSKDISESYMLSPMTQEEAEVALSNAEDKCLQFDR